MELITFCCNSVRVVNERPLTALSSDPRDNTVLTPASVLTPGLESTLQWVEPMTEINLEGTTGIIWLWLIVFGMIGWLLSFLLCRVGTSGVMPLGTWK